MTTAKPHPSLDLVWRSIVPSSTTVIVCLFAGIITVLFGLLGAAGQQGSTIGLQPSHVSFLGGFSHTLSHNFRGDMLAIVLWVVIVSLVFVSLEFLFGSYAMSQSEIVEHESSGRHAGMSELTWLSKRMLWRVIVGFIAVIGAALLVQLTTWVSMVEKSATSVVAFAQNARSLTLACLVWALVYYACIVLVRLYTFRTNIL